MAKHKSNWDGYDQLKWVTRHAIQDANGQPVTPIVTEIALCNEGWVCTWAQVFWREGFCIHDGRAAFLSIGDIEGYGTYSGIVRFVVGGAGVEVDREGLEAYLSSEAVAVTFETIDTARSSAPVFESLLRV